MFLEDKRSEFQVLASDCQSTPIYKNESYLELVYGTTKKRKIKLWLIETRGKKKNQCFRHVSCFQFHRNFKLKAENHTL